ncbi:MAG: hypothetical protein EAZ57_06100 [Cytophagales bacterium]|nr:MAG: hypothetical protein EAZ67_08290 [Cytophagales bacterium]TAF60754.1 MAG: hypothetical protein EAZ57_06100 [Cytophagales bacterium]
MKLNHRTKRHAFKIFENYLNPLKISFLQTESRQKTNKDTIFIKRNVFYVHIFCGLSSTKLKKA